jgi:putative acetyltransferase
MQCDISPLTIESYEDVIRLWDSCEGVRLTDADSRPCVKAYLRRNPGMSFVARSGGRIVGAVLGGHDGRRGYLHHLAVHPAFRRKGIARRLVDCAIHALRVAGIRKCHIFILNGNAEGMAFWESVGWQARTDIRIVSKTIDV